MSELHPMKEKSTAPRGVTKDNLWVDVLRERNQKELLKIGFDDAHKHLADANAANEVLKKRVRDLERQCEEMRSGEVALKVALQLAVSHIFKLEEDIRKNES